MRISTLNIYCSLQRYFRISYAVVVLHQQTKPRAQFVCPFYLWQAEAVRNRKFVTRGNLESDFVV